MTSRQFRSATLPQEFTILRRTRSRVAARTHLLARRVDRRLKDLRARPHPSPTFVLGHQKSGTSVIASLLAQACGLGVAIDMKREIDQPIFHLVQKGTLTFETYRRRNAFEFSHDVIKEANLTPMAAHLLRNYPSSKFIFVFRDPRQNIRSILQRLHLPGDPHVLAGEQWRTTVSDAWELVLDGGWLGIDSEDYVEALARRWQLFADIYTAHRERMIAVRYEDFALDKPGAIYDLAIRLGLPVVRDISSQVDVQHQHKGDPSVVLSEYYGGAQRIEQISRICRRGMVTAGYTTESH